jgi:hypothetical protein
MLTVGVGIFLLEIYYRVAVSQTWEMNAKDGVD